MNRKDAAFVSARHCVACVLVLISVALASVLCGASPGWAQDELWPETLAIGTAAKGGTYDAYGRGLANLLRDKVRIAAATRETNGPEQNS